jgi:dTMP kinase
MQGRLIVFEGVEGSGKTTQIQQIYSWLHNSGIFAQLSQQGYCSQLILTREPGGTELGKAIRQLLLTPPAAGLEEMQDRTELLLYAADRAQHVEVTLKPLLANGALILCDRYTDSTVAYQSYGRGLNRGLIDQLNQIATSGLKSDLTLWLDLDVRLGLERAQRRAAQDRIEQADLGFHQRVQQGFAQLAQTEPERMIRIDAGLESEYVTQQIQQILSQQFQTWFPLLQQS